MKRLFQLLTAVTLLSTLASASPVFTTPANGALFGNAGSIVGWGFTISDSTEFALVTQTGFCITATQPSNLPCTSQIQAVGTYTDFSLNAPVVGPSQDSPSITQNFNMGVQTGFGAFQINGGTAAGTKLSGEIAIVFDLFTGDPNTNPAASQIGGDNFVSLPASVTVTGSAAAPEPGTMVSLGLGLLGLCWFGRRSSES
jgi:hypothetical protein